MLIRPALDIKPSDITPREVYMTRRQILAAATGLSAALPMPAGSQGAALSTEKSPFPKSEPMAAPEEIRPYNNFYEFGTEKGGPPAHGAGLKTTPWTIKVDGLVDKP